jgi:rubrerythrin
MHLTAYSLTVKKTSIIGGKLRHALLTAQKTEITEHYVYLNLAKRIKDDHNRQVVEQIG